MVSGRACACQRRRALRCGARDAQRPCPRAALPRTGRRLGVAAADEHRARCQVEQRHHEAAERARCDGRPEDVVRHKGAHRLLADLLPPVLDVQAEPRLRTRCMGGGCTRACMACRACSVRMRGACRVRARERAQSARRGSARTRDRLSAVAHAMTMNTTSTSCGSGRAVSRARTQRRTRAQSADRAGAAAPPRAPHPAPPSPAAPCPHQVGDPEAPQDDAGRLAACHGVLQQLFRLACPRCCAALRCREPAPRAALLLNTG